MPELEWRFGYFYALALMTAVSFATLAYFRHKGWLGGTRRRRHAARADSAKQTV
jgi:magnesium transporter